jgi:hypothetical protein
LGEKKVATSGKSYPTEKEYFILKDAPEVAKVYGEEPKAIDIMFPSDDENIIIPTWFKWYSAAKENSNGEIIGGMLNCYGDGPDLEGNPGSAVYLKGRDPITGVTPKRPCMGPSCPDWKNARGQQQCKQSMQVLVMLPLVSMYGVYKINTSSWNAIRSFHSMVKWIKGWNGGIIKGQMLQIKRVEQIVQYMDNNGNPQARAHHIMELHPNEEFEKNHGGALIEKIAATFKNNVFLPTERELLEAPSPLAFQLPSEEERIEEKVKDRLELAKEILESPEFQAVLGEFVQLTGKPKTDKELLTGILKRCEEADWKAAAVSAFQAHVDAVRKSMQPVEPEPVPTTETRSEDIV